VDRRGVGLNLNEQPLTLSLQLLRRGHRGLPGEREEREAEGGKQQREKRGEKKRQREGQSVAGRKKVTVSAFT